MPVIVKDNYETVDMPTTAGSLSLKGMMTGKDAFIVKRLRDAGALMIAKSNMAEFAFSPIETVNSILPGYTRNPYDTSRVTAGSSGGSAAGAAANFAMLRWRATPATRFAARQRTRRSSASARRWAS